LRGRGRKIPQCAADFLKNRLAAGYDMSRGKISRIVLSQPGLSLDIFPDKRLLGQISSIRTIG
jgi:hypothetical protein